MPESTLVLFAALHLEAAAVRRAFNTVGIATPIVHVIGMRACHLSAVPAIGEHRSIMMLGLAGGLDPSLRIGDVVFDGPAEISLPNTVHRGRVFTSPELVESVEKKTALFTATGAIAVDMEQAIVAAWAAAHGHTVMGLRSISDDAGDRLDPIFSKIVDEVGRPLPKAIVTALFRRPVRAVDLIRLGRRSKLALGQLAAAAVAIANRVNDG